MPGSPLRGTRNDAVLKQPEETQHEKKLLRPLVCSRQKGANEDFVDRSSARQRLGIDQGVDRFLEPRWRRLPRRCRLSAAHASTDCPQMQCIAAGGIDDLAPQLDVLGPE